MGHFYDVLPLKQLTMNFNLKTKLQGSNTADPVGLTDCLSFSTVKTIEMLPGRIIAGDTDL